MKRMKRREQAIDVVGVWDGTETGEVTTWLTSNKYVFQLQTEDQEQIDWRTKPRFGHGEPTDEEKQARSQLVILGKRMYDECTLAPGSYLVLVEEGRLAAYDADVIEEQFEDA